MLPKVMDKSSPLSPDCASTMEGVAAGLKRSLKYDFQYPIIPSAEISSTHPHCIQEASYFPPESSDSLPELLLILTETLDLIKNPHTPMFLC